MGMLSWFRKSAPVEDPALASLRTQVGELEAALMLSKGTHAASGVDILWGQYDYEFNSNLKDSEKWATLDRMETDPHIKGGLKAIELPLVNANWEFQAASDDPRDMEIRDFCEANLLRRSNDLFGREYWIQTSFEAQRLREILRMLPHGFSMFAKSTRRVGTSIVFDRLHWLEPSSVERWGLDDQDNLLYIERNFKTPNDRMVYGVEGRIKAEDIKLYPWDMYGARYEGRPDIRSSYGAWFRKNRLQKLAVIWAQKVGAPVPYGSYPSDWPDDIRRKFIEFVRSCRGTAPAEAHGVFPQDKDGRSPELKYAGVDTGEVDRMTAGIAAENAEISHGQGTRSSLAGETKHGSRAVADVQSELEGSQVQAVAKIICEWENHGPGNLRGVVEELVDTNYANVKEYPQLVCTGTDPHENFQHDDILIKAVQVGIAPKTPEFMQQFMERHGYKLSDDAYEVQAEKDEEEQEPDIPPNEEDEEEEGVEAGLESIDAYRKRIAPLLAPVQEGAPKGGGFRYPNKLEATVCRLAAIQESYRVGERDIKTALREVKRMMFVELRSRVRKGANMKRDLDGLQRLKFRNAKKAAAVLVDVLRENAQRGIDHAAEEIDRQQQR